MGLESIKTWVKRAKCRDNSTIDFFSANNHEIWEVKRYCTDCPVLDLCNTYAVAHEERGIWGGTSYKQRRRLATIVVETIRQMYYLENLLESRPGAVEAFLEQQQRPEEQLPEHNYPNAV